MTQDIQKIRDRIKQMLAIAANDASTPGEKSNAIRMASTLMRRYNLEREDFEDQEPDFNKVVVNGLWKRLTPWESILAAFVSTYVVPSTFPIVSKEGGSRGLHGDVGQANISFSGQGPDAEMAAATYIQLRDALMSQCIAKYNQAVRGAGRQYAMGFVHGLFEVAREAARLESNKEEVSRALVRTDMLKEQSKQWYLSQTKGSLRSRGGARVRRSEAYESGVRDGRVADRSKRHAIAGRLS